MSKEKIEQLTRQLQEKEQEISTQKVKVSQLRNKIAEITKQMNALDAENTALLKKAPTYLKELDGVPEIIVPRTSTQENDEQFIQQQIDRVTRLEDEYKERFTVDASTKLRALLESINKLLKENQKNFPSDEIEKLVNESGIANMKLPALNMGSSELNISMQSNIVERPSMSILFIDEYGEDAYSSDTPSGFDLLLDILGENSGNYGFLAFSYSSTKNKNLSAALSRGISQLNTMISADEMEQIKFDGARRQLSMDKSKLSENHQQKTQLDLQTVDLSGQITELEKVTIKNLTEACSLISQELSLARQQFELEQEEQRQRELELEKQHEFEQEEQRKEVQIKKERERVEQLAREQKEQRNILATEIKKMLKEYKTQRDEHYHTKDFLASGDKEARDVFIAAIGGETEEVGGLLDAYNTSGDSTELLKKITDEMDAFKGVKMQATLNRVIVKLMDAEAGPQVAQSTTAEEILQSLDKQVNHKQYVANMRDIYAKVDGLRAYANTLTEREKGVINQLVDALKKDVDHFISNSPDGIPQKPAYDKFAMKFKARLHSQDDLMSEHKSWGAIVANVLLSVATLFKLIISKATTGRASFFFDKTEKQKDVEAHVDDSLKVLEVTCSA